MMFMLNTYWKSRHIWHPVSVISLTFSLACLLPFDLHYSVMWMSVGWNKPPLRRQEEDTDYCLIFVQTQYRSGLLIKWTKTALQTFSSSCEAACYRFTRGILEGWTFLRLTTVLLWKCKHLSLIIHSCWQSCPEIDVSTNFQVVWQNQFLNHLEIYILNFTPFSCLEQEQYKWPNITGIRILILWCFPSRLTAKRQEYVWFLQSRNQRTRSCLFALSHKMKSSQNYVR